MIRRNLQLRPLARTTTLLYLHVSRSSPTGPGDTQGGSKQLPVLQHVGTRACVGKTGTGRSDWAGTPPIPLLPQPHTHPPPCLNTELLGSRCHLPPVNLSRPSPVHGVSCDSGPYGDLGMLLPTQGQSYCNRPKASEESQQCVSREWHKNEQGGQSSEPFCYWDCLRQGGQLSTLNFP